MEKKMTIYDIAKIAGVSPKTVSRVINNEENVAPKTLEKVQKVIKDLNYTQNSFARNLKIKKDKTILVSIRTTNGFPLQWMQMLIEQIGILCMNRGISVLVEYLYDDNSFEKSILYKSDGYIDGVVLFYEKKDDIRINLLKKKNIPFVVFERAYDESVRYVSNNNYQVLYDTFDSLCKHGLKNAELLLRSDTLVNRDRVNGVLDAFRNNGLDINDVRISYEIGDAQAAYNHVVESLKNGFLPQVFFVSGDERAAGLYKALGEKGIIVGKDVSVIGFDDIPVSSFLCPPLTSIRPCYEKLAQSLLDMVLSEEKGDSMVVPASLVIRESLSPQYQ
ncbi:MAG: LacI family DNA-binding transcriptional regulator [Candidatus Ornithospirochaeta sp.]